MHVLWGIVRLSGFQQSGAQCTVGRCSQQEAGQHSCWRLVFVFSQWLLYLLLQILARSSPTDKYNLVKLLKSRGEVVAVTGGLSCSAPKPAWPAS